MVLARNDPGKAGQEGGSETELLDRPETGARLERSDRSAEAYTVREGPWTQSRQLLLGNPSTCGPAWFWDAVLVGSVGPPSHRAGLHDLWWPAWNSDAEPRTCLQCRS